MVYFFIKQLFSTLLSWYELLKLAFNVSCSGGLQSTIGEGKNLEVLSLIIKT